MEKRIITENIDDRLDVYLSKELNLSRSVIKDRIDNELIKINNKKTKSSYKLRINDEIEIEEVIEKILDAKPQNIPIDIIYQDDDILVINKPKGMVVHPAKGSLDSTLVNALMYHIKDLSSINGILRPGIVHRIDKDTTGLLVVAKNDNAHKILSEDLKTHDIKRTYIALVDGIIEENKGFIDAPIGRDKDNRMKYTVVSGGKEAKTHFEVIERFESKTLLKVSLETGRTHQIRVHMRYINHPIYGDPLYGARKTDTTNGQYLHAYKLEFIHPITHKKMEFEAPLPEYFKNYLETLR